MADQDSKPVFKILSIDGGGIRGLYSAKMLEVFEARFSTSVAKHFDLICGTSTGGLIALALATGLSAAEVTKFYKTYGPEIFPAMWKWTGFRKQLFGGGKYSNDVLRGILEHLFDDKRIGDSECLLCIPSYSLTMARPYIFRFDHPEGKLGRDNEQLCVEVALATSAAPTYFPIVEVDNQQLVDGGVCANNPALVGLMEALRHFVGEDKPFGSVEILSVETISVPVGKRHKKHLARGALHWREELVSCFMEGQARTTDFILHELSALAYVPLSYVRLKGENVSPEQASLLSLDNASPASLKLLETLGKDAGDNLAVQKDVCRFFDTGRTYDTQKKGA